MRYGADTTMKYLLLKPNTEPPDISEFKPFRSVVIVEEVVTTRWQIIISDWLVSSGCLYMMAWGKDQPFKGAKKSRFTSG